MVPWTDKREPFYMSIAQIKQLGNRQVLVPLMVLGLIFIISGSLISLRVDEAIQSYQDAYLSLSAHGLHGDFDKMAQTHRNRLKVLAIRPELGEGQFVIKAEGNSEPLGKLLRQEMVSALAVHISALDSKGQVLFQQGSLDFNLPGKVIDLRDTILVHPPIKDPQTELDEVVHSRLLLANDRFYLLTIAPLLDVEDIVGVIMLVHALDDATLLVLVNEMFGSHLAGSSTFHISLASRQKVINSTLAQGISLAFPAQFPAPFDSTIDKRTFRHVPVAINKTPFFLILSSDSPVLSALHAVIQWVLLGVFVTVLVLLLIIILFNLRQIHLQEHARGLQERETRFRRLADAALEGIAFSEHGVIVDVNQALTEMFACTARELIGKSLQQLVITHHKILMEQAISSSRLVASELSCQRIDGSTFIAEIRSRLLEEFGHAMVVTAIRDISARKEVEEQLREAKELAERSFHELQRLDQQKTELNYQLNQTLRNVREANHRIMESIRYAERIQRSLLPKAGSMQERLPDSFFSWQPRDVVSGDLVFLHQTDLGQVIVLMDCTGHGVPGALMTMIAHSTLHRIIVSEGCGDDPAEILRRLNIQIKNQIHPEEDDDDDDFFTDVGLDCGVCFLPNAACELIFAGAYTNLFLVDKDGPRTISGNRCSIGYRRSEETYLFDNKHLALHPQTNCYMFSDGILDQLGGPYRRPFGKKRILSLIAKLIDDPISGHGAAILRTVNEYRGDREWQDDVTLVGFRATNGMMTAHSLFDQVRQ